MEKLNLDEAELQSRREFFEITADDLKRLASLRSFAEKNTDDIIEDLYRLILGHRGGEEAVHRARDARAREASAA